MPVALPPGTGAHAATKPVFPREHRVPKIPFAATQVSHFLALQIPGPMNLFYYSALNTAGHALQGSVIALRKAQGKGISW